MKSCASAARAASSISSIEASGFPHLQVVDNGTGKQFVLLQNHADAGMQFIQVIVFYRDAVDPYFSRSGVV